jgi:hypothetical protein
VRLVLPMGPRKQHLPPSRSYPIVGVGLGCVPLLDGHGRALPHAQRPRHVAAAAAVPRAVSRSFSRGFNRLIKVRSVGVSIGPLKFHGGFNRLAKEHDAGSFCRSLYALALIFPTRAFAHTHTGSLRFQWGFQ